MSGIERNTNSATELLIKSETELPKEWDWTSTKSETELPKAQFHFDGRIFFAILNIMHWKKY